MSNLNDRESILYAFAVEATHDRSTLERYLRQYPELTDDLIDLSLELRLATPTPPASVSSIADVGVEAAWQEFVTSKPRAACPNETVNPFASFRGAAFAILAKTLNVPRSFLTAFRDGLVMASSIPESFVRRFADATSVSVESARDYFARAQPVTAEVAFKSDVKPSQQGQRTFREFVTATEMTDEQRQLLIQDCDADELD